MALLAAAAVGGGGWTLADGRREALEQAEGAARDMAGVAAEHAQRLLGMGDLVIDAVTLQLERRGTLEGLRDDPGFHALMRDYAAKLPGRANLWVVGPDARVIAMNGRFPAPPVDVSGREVWRAHVEQGLDRHVGEAILGTIDREPLFTYSRRLTRPDGGLAAVVLISFRPGSFDRLRFPGPLHQNAVIALYRDDGRMVARSPLDPALLEKGVPTARMRPGSPVGADRDTSPVDGQLRIVGWRRLEGWPVVAIAGIAEEVALAPWRTGLYLTAGLLAAVLAGAALLTRSGVRAMRREEVLRRDLAATVCELRAANGRLGEALAEKAMLFREVHHRIKNNLQVTSALLQLQASRFKDAGVREAFEQTEDRLRSIGLLHESLYRTDQGGDVDLADYLGRLVGMLAAAHGAEARGIRIVLALDPCAIALERAVPVALVLTEVITNAFKHGFAGAEPEQAHVLTVSACRAGGLYRVEVRDTGPGMPEGAAASMGTSLIRSLSRQAEAEYAYANEGGTVFRLALPLERAPAAAEAQAVG
ncbi:MAG TPA: histidine kinase dimerization/phosphoacceptor domain -containing protein [Azospirillaceae bacterium]|nr:histidine kinase dimerization/phosphoacceptor domain -containing protein [Azospirillaceae bacterium]